MIAEGPSANLPPHIALEPALSSRSLNVLVLGLATLVAPLLIAGCDRQSGQQAQPQAGSSAELPAGVIDRSHKGAPLPDLAFADPSGKQLKLASLAGKPLLINLWATWCAPCVAELPMLNQLAAAKTGQLQVVTISEDFKGPEKVAAFLADKHLTHLAPWLDPDNKLSSQYQVTTLPTTVYYDAKGHEVWRFTGGRDWLGKETAGLLAEATGG